MGKKSATDINYCMGFSADIPCDKHLSPHHFLLSPSCSALERSISLPLRAAPCQEQRSASPSAGVSVLPQQLRSSDVSHSASCCLKTRASTLLEGKGHGRSKPSEAICFLCIDLVNSNPQKFSMRLPGSLVPYLIDSVTLEVLSLAGSISAS